MAPLAILLLVERESGSFALAGVTVGAGALANGLSAPLHGIGIDRIGPRRWLPLVAALQSAALIALVLAVRAEAPQAMIVAIAVARGATVPPIASALRTLWRILLGEQAEAAYALDAISQEAIFLLGPLLVGAAVAVSSPEVAILLQGVFMLVGTALFLATAAVKDWPASGARAGSHWGALSSPAFRLVLPSILLSGIALGAGEVALPALGVHLGRPGLAGVLLGMLSVGSIGGGLVYGTRSWSGSVTRRHALLLAAMGIAALPLVAVPPVWGAILLSVVAGLPYAPVFSTQYALVSETAPPGNTTEAFSWQASLLVTGAAVGSAVTGLLVQAAGLPEGFVLYGAAAMLAALPLLAVDRSTTGTGITEATEGAASTRSG